MFPLELLILPFIGALIGYITNVVAIKMLFRPREPVYVPGTAWFVQGLLPKRKKALAADIAKTVDNDLLPLADIRMQMRDSGYQEQLLQILTEHVDERIAEALPTLVPQRVQRRVRRYVRDAVGREAAAFINKAYDEMWERLQSDMRLGDIVRRRIEALDLDQLEGLVFQVAKKELGHIEKLGAALGFIIGVVQALFLLVRIV